MEASTATEPQQPSEGEQGPIPEGAGLPSRSMAEVEANAAGPDAASALERSAQGEQLAPADASELLSFFLDNGDLPGDSEEVTVAITLGRGKRAREFAWIVRAIGWDEWSDAQERTAPKTEGERFNALWLAAYVVARATVKPQLGPMLQQARVAAEGKGVEPPSDSAALLMQMFQRQSGVLLELNAHVLGISKLQQDNQAVREVEAGKT